MAIAFLRFCFWYQLVKMHFLRLSYFLNWAGFLLRTSSSARNHQSNHENHQSKSWNQRTDQSWTDASTSQVRETGNYWEIRVLVSIRTVLSDAANGESEIIIRYETESKLTRLPLDPCCVILRRIIYQLEFRAKFSAYFRPHWNFTAIRICLSPSVYPYPNFTSYFFWTRI